MTLLLAAAVLAGIALPHLLRLDRVLPSTAIALWGSAVALRALSVLFGIAYLVFVFPATAAFNAVTHWCWHTIVPLLATHLGLDGHRLGDAAVVIASFAVAASVLSVGVGLVKAGRSVRRLLAHASVGVGPQQSVIVGGSGVLLAAAGITRPKVVVSAGALAVLDDEELAAGLDHERGHIARRHRFVLLLAELCRGIGRFLPGTRHAVAQLVFHIERDADHWALGRRHDHLALASAICKAATLGTRSSPVLATLGGSAVRARLDQLMDGSADRAAALTSRSIRCAAVGLVALTLTLAVVGSASTVAAARAADGAERLQHCDA